VNRSTTLFVNDVTVWVLFVQLSALPDSREWPFILLLVVAFVNVVSPEVFQMLVRKIIGK